MTHEELVDMVRNYYNRANAKLLTQLLENPDLFAYELEQYIQDHMGDRRDGIFGEIMLKRASAWIKDDLFLMQHTMVWRQIEDTVTWSRPLSSLETDSREPLTNDIHRNVNAQAENFYKPIGWFRVGRYALWGKERRAHWASGLVHRAGYTSMFGRLDQYRVAVACGHYIQGGPVRVISGGSAGGWAVLDEGVDWAADDETVTCIECLSAP